MRTWHFYKKDTGIFTKDSISGQSFSGIENWIASNTPKDCKAIETTGNNIKNMQVDPVTGEMIRRIA